MELHFCVLAVDQIPLIKAIWHPNTTELDCHWVIIRLPKVSEAVLKDMAKSITTTPWLHYELKHNKTGCFYKNKPWCRNHQSMMPSSNGNIFCLTDPLWRESTGHQWTPPPPPPTHTQRPVTGSFDVFFDLRLKKTVERTIKTPVIWEAIALIMTPPYWSCYFTMFAFTKWIGRHAQCQ